MKKSGKIWHEVLIGTMVGILAILVTTLSYWLLIHVF
jgi:hypothetical protein